MEISEKDWKNLNNEVVRLRDELAKMKRVYEDLFYNLDDDNFSGRFLKEKNGMKAGITANAEGIKTSVEELNGEIAGAYSSFEQTANEIKTTVTNLEDFNSTVFQQTAEGFYFIGDVALKGKLYDTDFEKGYFEVTDSGNYTDFEFVSTFGGTERNIFTIRDAGDSTTLNINGNNLLNTTGEHTLPYGTWDFQYATVKNVPAVFG